MLALRVLKHRPKIVPHKVEHFLAKAGRNIPGTVADIAAVSAVPFPSAPAAIRARHLKLQFFG